MSSSDKIKSLFQSRRFWVAIAGVFISAAGQLGLEISPEAIEQIVLLLAAWIVGDSLNKTGT